MYECKSMRFPGRVSIRQSFSCDADPEMFYRTLFLRDNNSVEKLCCFVRGVPSVLFESLFYLLFWYDSTSFLSCGADAALLRAV